MRVLHLYTRFNAGGPARMVLDLLPHLAGLGVESLVAAGQVGSGEASLEEEARRRGVEILPVPGLEKGGNPLRALAALSRLMARTGPDLVHTNMARAGLLGRLAAWRRGVPGRVHTFHGHLLQGYFGPLRTRLLCRVERLLARISTGLVAVSPRVAADLERAGAVAPGGLTLLPPGLDLDPFLAIDSGGTVGERPVVGWAGRLVPVKDPDLLGRVARLLPRVRFLAAGGGPLLARMREGHPQVEWLGHCTDMVRFYGRLDALLLTSVNEGLPLVLLEALAAGIPVVACAAGGVPDLVRDGRTGLLAGDREEATLATLLDRLLADGKKRRRIAGEGRAEVVNYAAGKIATKLASFYRACLPEPSESD